MKKGCIRVAWPDGREEDVPENYAIRLMERGQAKAAQSKEKAKTKKKR